MMTHSTDEAILEETALSDCAQRGRGPVKVTAALPSTRNAPDILA
jgi:hypothetical protein